jgi:hypothetical protein
MTYFLEMVVISHIVLSLFQTIASEDIGRQVLTYGERSDIIFLTEVLI